jgi:hypothetical protein
MAIMAIIYVAIVRTVIARQAVAPAPLAIIVADIAIV